MVTETLHLCIIKILLYVSATCWFRVE